MILLGVFGVLLLLLGFGVVLVRRRQEKRSSPGIFLPPPPQCHGNRTLAPDRSQLEQYTSGGDASPPTGPTGTSMVRSTLGGDYAEILQESRHFYPGQSSVVEHSTAAPQDRAARAQSKKGSFQGSGLAAPVHSSVLLLKG